MSCQIKLIFHTNKSLTYTDDIYTLLKMFYFHESWTFVLRTLFLIRMFSSTFSTTKIEHKNQKGSFHDKNSLAPSLLIALIIVVKRPIEDTT